MNHLTPTEMARQVGIDRRQVINFCLAHRIPIFQGRIDSRLFEGVWEDVKAREKGTVTMRIGERYTPREEIPLSDAIKRFLADAYYDAELSARDYSHLLGRLEHLKELSAQRHERGLAYIIPNNTSWSYSGQGHEDYDLVAVFREGSTQGAIIKNRHGDIGPISRHELPADTEMKHVR